MRSILDDNSFDPMGLVVVGTPSFSIRQYIQSETRVLEALRVIAQQRGWGTCATSPRRAT